MSELWALQRTQWGKQASYPNGGVAATVRLVGLTVDDEPAPTFKEYGPQGELAMTGEAKSLTSSTHKIAGRSDYNEFAWLFAGALGNVAPTPPTGGNTARQRLWTPPADNIWTPMIISQERGADTRGRYYQDLIISGFQVTPGPDKYDVSGDAFSAAVEKDHNLTPDLAGLLAIPILGPDTKLYLDSSNQFSGSPTQLESYYESQWGLSGIYVPDYPGGVNGNNGPGIYVQKAPKMTGQLTVEGNSTQEDLILSLQQNDAYGYLRIESIGPVIENEFTVDLGNPSAGDFTLTYKAQTTATIAFDAAASDVKTALAALSSIGTNNVDVTGSAGGPFSVYLKGTLLDDSSALTGDGTGLTGGTFAITAHLIKYLLRIDSAIKFTKQSAYKAVGQSSGLLGSDYPFTIVKDPAWTSVNSAGQMFQITLVNIVPAI